MKVFTFDPATGTRGKQIDTAKRIDWTSEYLEVDFAPTGFSDNASVTVHRDAGIGLGDDELSYRHPTEWVCFCHGEFHSGVNDDGSSQYTWDWTVLPPLNV